MENKKQPEKVNRFNFGAFVFPCLWSLFNRQYILSAVSGILYFLIWHRVFFSHSYIFHSTAWSIYDIILILIRVIIGIKGTRLAWDSQLKKKGADADAVSFRRKQFGWSIAGLAVMGCALLAFLYYTFLPLFMEIGNGHRYDYEETDTSCLDEKRFELWNIYPVDDCRIMFKEINEYSNHKFEVFVESDDSIALGSVKKKNGYFVDEILADAESCGLINTRLCRFMWSAHEDSGKLKLYAFKVQTRDGRALLDGRSITNAKVVSSGNNTFDVVISLDSEGSRILKIITEELKKGFYALTINNEVYDIYPNNSYMFDDFRIRGFESKQEAEVVANSLLSAASKTWLWEDEDDFLDENY